VVTETLVRRLGRSLLSILIGVFVAGCASVPKDYPRTPSSAFPDPAATAIGRYFLQAARRQPGESGFALLREGREAFTARIALTDLAEKSLDLQYDIWEQDATGHILAERLVRAADRGVRVLTNSLASNDVLAAHAGYAKYRKALIEGGVELYELRPYPGPVEKEILLGSSKAALHTKAIVFDRKDVFIGSFNLDPRSSVINTEAGLFVESPELAARVINYLDEGVAAQNAYRVLLDADGRLAWVIEAEGQTRRYYAKDPQSAAGQRATAGLIGILPVEGQL
jgi:phosphatidylserine/phosphatidylglycerophosphate/cardiolipin synthase-like enzyme